ncbi:MAG: cysteine desulfurase [Planctomycetaceae bacterium]|nr:cysteine desulfurase [Planctomycetaceae bacterium]
MRLIYLDYNSTTPVAPEAQEVVLPFLAEHFGNPSSHHALGRAAFEVIEEGRYLVANLLQAERAEIIFTSSGTESCNLALIGTAFHVSPRFSGHLVISSIEHPAVTQSAKFLTSLGYRLTVVPPNSHGIVEPQSIVDAIEENTFLASVTMAHHETGIIQPVAAIAERCRHAGVLVHTDACQAVGKIPVHVSELNVDLLSFTGHKFHAPKGTGGLYVKHGTPVSPILHGEGNEGGLRSGMENVGGIVALGKAAAVAERYMPMAMERMTDFRDRLEKQLTATVHGLMINGKDAVRLPNTTSLTFPHVNADKMQRRLPELCFSTSAAVYGRSKQGSPMLSVLGRSAVQMQGTIRLSIGRFNTEEQMGRSCELLASAWEECRTK